jgi:hypothetical protein
LVLSPKRPEARKPHLSSEPRDQRLGNLIYPDTLEVRSTSTSSVLRIKRSEAQKPHLSSGSKDQRLRILFCIQTQEVRGPETYPVLRNFEVSGQRFKTSSVIDS